MEENKGKLYDVSTSTDHQVYNGVSGETQATTNAVNKTKGMVMLYNQRPINALFHSDGGGYTEDSVNVWGSDVPYLKGERILVLAHLHRIGRLLHLVRPLKVSSMQQVKVSAN